MNIQTMKKKLSGFWVGGILSAALAFLLAVYAPLELFLGNQADFWFDLPTFLPRVILLFVILTVLGIAAFALLRLWGRLPYSIGLALGFTALLGCYIQGSFLAADLPPLDGTTVDWNADPLARGLSVAVFAVLLAAAVFLMIKFRGLFKKVVWIGSAGLTAMLVLTLATLLMTTPLTDKAGYLQPTDHHAFQYSGDTNLIVLVVDAVDSGAFQDALAANPEFADTFDDFTYYDDALAAYPFTRNSLPMIFTGQWYENKTAYDEYVTDAFQNSPLMEKLTEENYAIGLYNNGEIHLDADAFEGVFENQIKVRSYFSSYRASFKLIAKMAAIRYAPWDLKRFGYDAAEYAAAVERLSDTGYDPVQKENAAFYSSIKETNPITVTEEKCARFIHIEGAHVPYQYDKEVNVIENGTYLQNIEATITICDTYLDRLKESGVYDNSVIVILGDHGFDEAGRLEGRMHPAVLIKGIGETGEEMAVNRTPISYEQLAEAFVDLLEGASSSEVFPADAYPEGRRMLLYWYLYEDFMDEYYARGRADEIELFERTDPNYDR